MSFRHGRHYFNNLPISSDRLTAPGDASYWKKKMVTGCCVPIFPEIIRQFRKPRGNGPLQQLAQKSFCRNHDGVFGEKSVDRFVLQADDRLKSMHGVRLGLEVRKPRRENRVAHLHLNKKPGPSVPHDEEIHFAFLFIAHMAQLEIAKA